MVTIKQVRDDLRDIRYYYSKKDIFDSASVKIVQNEVVEKVKRYNEAISKAPPRLYDLYIALYTQNNTQAALSYEWDFSPDYIKELNLALCQFLFDYFNAKK